MPCTAEQQNAEPKNGNNTSKAKQGAEQFLECKGNLTCAN